jgi:hypothetical protein
MQPACSLMLVLCWLAMVTVADDELVIPEGIRYKKASDEANAAAIQTLTKVFSAESKEKEVVPHFDKVLICGPGLWRALKDDPLLPKLENGGVEFRVPVLDKAGNATSIQMLEGESFQSPDEQLLFWKSFANRVDFSELKIRKMNSVELRIFWAMIPFDITEPIFILENKKHKILVMFNSPDLLKISWIDDFQKLSLGNGASSKVSDTKDKK